MQASFKRCRGKDSLNCEVLAATSGGYMKHGSRGNLYVHSDTPPNPRVLRGDTVKTLQLETRPLGDIPVSCLIERRCRRSTQGFLRRYPMTIPVASETFYFSMTQPDLVELQCNDPDRSCDIPIPSSLSYYFRSSRSSNTLQSSNKVDSKVPFWVLYPQQEWDKLSLGYRRT